MTTTGDASADGAGRLIAAIKQGDEAEVRRLLDETPLLARAREASGASPLMTALYHRRGELVDELLARGAAVDVHAAAALGRLEPLQDELAAGRINDVAYDGWTPLHLAAFFGQDAAAEQLLTAGASVNAVSANSMRNTPLHAALAGGHAEVALRLIAHGADVTARDAGGHTPLHIAAENGFTDAVRALLARGADPYAVDQEDRTPIARAAARNRDDIVDILNLGH